jgi:hypothetical protein
MDDPTKTKAEPAPSLGDGPAHNAEPRHQVYRSFAELAAAFGVEQHQEKTRKWVDVIPEGARE